MGTGAQRCGRSGPSKVSYGFRPQRFSFPMTTCAYPGSSPLAWPESCPTTSTEMRSGSKAPLRINTLRIRSARAHATARASRSDVELTSIATLIESVRLFGLPKRERSSLAISPSVARAVSESDGSVPSGGIGSASGRVIPECDLHFAAAACAHPIRRRRRRDGMGDALDIRIPGHRECAGARNRTRPKLGCATRARIAPPRVRRSACP